jgi:hypothetical protein
MERETYLARFVARFTREVGDFLRTQLAVGLTLSCLTLVFQWRMGLLPIGTGRASLLALVLPYVVIVAAFGLYHLFRTAYLLDKELQANPRRRP